MMGIQANGGPASLKAEISFAPESLRNKVRVALATSLEDLGNYGTVQSLSPASNVVTLDFGPSGIDTTKFYHVIAWIDLNGDNTFNPDEPYDFPDWSVKITNDASTFVAWDYLNNLRLGEWVGYKWAARFLSQFLAVENLSAPLTAVSVTQDELTHNTGVTWSQSCSSSVEEYQFAAADQPLPASELAQDIWANSDFQAYVNSKLAANTDIVRNHDWGSDTVYTFRFNFTGSGEFKSGDLYYAIKKFGITDGVLHALVERASLKVIAIYVEAGVLQDTYDFDFSSQSYIVQQAATLQSSYPTSNDPAAGNVFKIKVDVSNGATSWNYSY